MHISTFPSLFKKALKFCTVLLLLSVSLNVSAQVPPNDELCGAIELIPAAACTFQTFSNVDASGSANTPLPTCENYVDADVWFKVTVPAGGTSVTVDSRGLTLTDGGMSAYSFTGTNCASYVLTQIACDGSNGTGGGGDMPRLTVNGTPGTTFYFRFFGFGGQTGTFGLCATANIPPSNDNCANATPLTVNPDYLCAATTNGTTINATQSPQGGTPTCGNAAGFNDDVWYTFVATGPQHRIVLSNIVGTSTNLTTVVYSGTCTALTQVFCGTTNSMDLSGLTANTTYYVRIYSNQATTVTSSFTICVGTAPPAPLNDNCANATNVTVNPDLNCGSVTAGGTESATPSTGAPVPTCGTPTGVNDDVWFKFVATANNNQVSLLNILPAATSMTMVVYSGTCGALVQVGCLNGTTQFFNTLVPNQTYYVRVYTNVPTVGVSATFNICVGTPPPPPANDDCPGAVNVPVNPNLNCGLTVPGNTQSATQSTTTPNPTCGTVNGWNDDIWFTFTATATNNQVSLLNIVPAATSMTMVVYSGTCAGGFTQIGCVNGTTLFLNGLVPTQVYYVRVYTNVATANVFGAFNICVGTPPPPPANDNCAGAVNVPVNPDLNCGQVVAGNTQSATQSTTPANPTCGTLNGWNDDVWFMFTATATNNAVSLLNQAGTTPFTFAVYSGNCTSLVQIGCSTTGSLGFNNLVPGNVYYVRVYTNTPTLGLVGTFNICVGTPAPLPTCSGNPPAGNTCAIATPVCNFDGYCGNTSASYTVDTWPQLTAAFCGSIENNSFVTFVASSATASFNVWVTSSEDNLGIQMMFYSGGCGSGAVTSYGCYSPINPTPIGGLPTVVTATGLTVGQTYYLMFDGYAGDVCDYVIAPINGVNVLSVTPSSASICAGQSVSLTASGGNGVYTWSPATGLNTTTGATVIASPTTTTTYTVTSTGSAGCPVTKTVTVTVNQNASLTLTSAPATTTQSVCANTAITNITYTVGSGGTGATVTGLPAGVTGVYAGSTVTISGTPTANGTYNYTITTTGGCAGAATATGTINVSTTSAVTLSSAPASTNQTVCINTPITTITYTVTGATGATVTGLPAGVTGVFSAGTVTISGTPTASGVFNYTVSTTGCGTATQTGTITVNTATLTLSSVAGSNNQTVCVNTPITTISYTTGGGATGATVSGLPAGVTGTFAGTTLTINGTPTATGSFPYTVTSTGPCPISLTGTITVSTQSTVTLSSAGSTNAQTVCANTAITPITYTIGGGGTGATVSGLPAGVTGTYAGGVFTISGAPTSAAGSPFTYTVSATGGCGTATQTGMITVSPASTLTLSSAAATANQTVCVNTAITPITYSGANGTTGATVTGLPAGVTGTYAGGVFTISGTPTLSGSFPYTVSSTGGCGTASQSGTITVSSASTLTLTSAPGTNIQTVCVNNPITPVTYTLGGGATGATVTNLPAGVTAVVSGSIVTISGTPTVPALYPYTITTTGGCSSATLAGSITVGTASTVTLSSAAGTNNQTVCINAPITGITYTIAGGAGGATVTGLPAGVTGTYAGNTMTINGTPTAAGIFTYTVNATGGCGTPSQTGTITVNAASTVTLSSGAGTGTQTVCVNTAITTITYATGAGVTGAAVTGLPAGVTGTYAGGVLTISGTPTAIGTFPYTVTTTGGCGTATQAGSITVNTVSTFTLSSAAATTNQTICANSAVTNITYAGGGGITGATVTGLPAGVTGTYAGGVFTISGTATSAGTFNYTVTTTGGCGTITRTGTITVSPALFANAGPNVTIASGQSTQLNGTGTAGANYLWTASGPLSLSSATILNPIANPLQTTTYTLTVSDPSSLCPSASSNVTVTVVTSCINVRNAFTPNGDGINERWFVYDQAFCLADGGVTVNVYNRYGNKVYENRNYTNNWDGTYKGKPVPDGTYYAVVEFRLANGKKTNRADRPNGAEIIDF